MVKRYVLGTYPERRFNLKISDTGFEFDSFDEAYEHFKSIDSSAKTTYERIDERNFIMYTTEGVEYGRVFNNPIHSVGEHFGYM